MQAEKSWVICYPHRVVRGVAQWAGTSRPWKTSVLVIWMADKSRARLRCGFEVWVFRDSVVAALRRYGYSLGSREFMEGERWVLARPACSGTQEAARDGLLFARES